MSRNASLEETFQKPILLYSLSTIAWPCSLSLGSRMRDMQNSPAQNSRSNPSQCQLSSSWPLFEPEINASYYKPLRFWGDFDVACYMAKLRYTPHFNGDVTYVCMYICTHTFWHVLFQTSIVCLSQYVHVYKICMSKGLYSLCKYSVCMCVCICIQ